MHALDPWRSQGRHRARRAAIGFALPLLVSGFASSAPPAAAEPLLTARAAPPSLGSRTAYDLRSGRLELPGLRASAGDEPPACFDAALVTRSASPLRFELEGLALRDCAASPPSPAHYDLRENRLRLAGLPIDGGGSNACYDAVLRRLTGEPLTLELATASAAPCADAGGAAPPPGGLSASVVLGSPTDRSIRATVLAEAAPGRVWIEYGLVPGSYNHRSAEAALQPGAPAGLTVDGLLADQRYHYRVMHRAEGSAAASAAAPASLRSARPAGSAFVFTVQADPHLDENADLATYQRTLANVRADQPDFHVDLGDTFMSEKHALAFSASSPPAASLAEVERRHAFEHGHFGRVASASALFLVNGNHDGELGWLRSGNGQDLAAWAAQTRKRYFVNPEPDGFYGGDPVAEPFVGRRAAWYAWHWGDALLVVLDPYWNASRGNDGWNVTLGERQYRWLADTLAGSRARFKFVFVHSLVGGLDGQMRGGIEGVPYFEWGGCNADGSPGFATRRAGWAEPIHALLVRHGVTAVFKGHDHFYARQELDGIVYQTVPQPSARNFSSGPALARDYRYLLGQFFSSSGHLRVSVQPNSATVQYVRSWLPAQENAERRNGQVADSWTVRAPASDSR